MNTNTTATEQLVQRMISFDGHFDGYPSMTCNDENLIASAIAENDPDTDGIILLSFLASDNVQTREQYNNAKAFIQAYVDTCWICNMSEGCNPVHEEIDSE